MTTPKTTLSTLTGVKPTSYYFFVNYEDGTIPYCAPFNSLKEAVKFRDANFPECILSKKEEE